VQCEREGGERYHGMDCLGLPSFLVSNQIGQEERESGWGERGLRVAELGPLPLWLSLQGDGEENGALGLFGRISMNF
jgi:hypothetical protein